MRKKAQPKHMFVWFDGRAISDRNATDKYVNTLQEIGFERIERELPDVTLGGAPLVSRIPCPKMRQPRRVGDWCVAINSDTPEKHSVLERIASRLGLNIQVKVMEQDEFAERERKLIEQLFAA